MLAIASVVPGPAARAPARHAQRKAGSVTARQRVLPGAIGLALFTLLGLSVDRDFWTAWWFYVGLGTVFATVFVEPFFVRPQDAMVNALAGVGAWASADRSGDRVLWSLFVVFAATVIVAALVAALTGAESGRRASQIKSSAYQYATRFGRAVVIGSAALSLEVLRLARHRGDAYIYLALATVALVVALVPNWSTIVRTLADRPLERPTVLGALGPRLLLLQGTSVVLGVGRGVQVKRSHMAARGWVVAVLPHDDGPRYEIALDRDSAAIVATYPQEVELEPVDHAEVVAGIAGPGTTDLKLVFAPLTSLSVGDPVVIDTPDSMLVYQVSHLELRRESWQSSAAVVPIAEATQVGRAEHGRMRVHPFLPHAHELIVVPDALMQVAPERYCRIGVMKGTEIEIGVNPSAHDAGHFAILGMSGMGKTAAAVRLCHALSAHACVIALDTTGEYETRLGVPTDAPDGLDHNGFWACEPAGDPPQKAMEYVERTMRLAHEEYRVGEPSRRVVLLEEAHGFIPEWNVATRPQQDATAFTTRMIMQARKFGLRFIIVSQRTAVVSKSALSQCENFIVLRTIDETSLAYLDAVIGGGVRDAIPRLERYEAVCVGPAFNTDGPVIVTLDAPVAAGEELEGHEEAVSAGAQEDDDDLQAADDAIVS